MKRKKSTKHWAAISWLLLVSIIVFFAVMEGGTFDSSIMALLPKSEQKPLAQRATERMADLFNKRLILLITGEDEDKVREAVKTVADSLRVLPDVTGVLWKVEENEISSFKDELYPYRFSIIEKGIRDLLRTENYEQIKQQALLRIYSPLSIGSGSIIEDPFRLFSELVLSRKNKLNIEVSDSLLKVTGTEHPTYMLMITLARDPFSYELQKRVLGAIAAQKYILAQFGISISMSGMLMHAEAGARQASGEITSIGIGSLLGITLVIMLIFRRPKPLILMLLSITIGCISAAAVTMLVFDHVHLVTFAFGAGLVGVSIDYALHFLCASQITLSENILRRILPGLLLGLFSSVVAYSALALTPFPGLRQMAIFSVVGLTASWLTVVLWFPLLTQGDRRKSLAAADKLDRIIRRFPRVEGSPIIILLLLGAFILAVQTVWNGSALDDIRLLQTSPDNILAQEKSVQKALGITSSSQFLLVYSDSLEMCLQKEELIISDLENLVSKGLLQGYHALSQEMPSLKRQEENYEMVRQLYDQQLRSLFGALGVSDNDMANAWSNYEMSRDSHLIAEEWLQQQEGHNRNDLFVMHTGTSTATVIRFTGMLSEDVKQKLIEISEVKSGMIFVDNIKAISDLMSNYRTDIIYWIIIAYVCVLVVFLYRYKYQLWRIVLPPLLASIFTLAILLQFESGLNVFHLMALILVLGIGLDMGIFLMETEEIPYTWLAVSLSTYTSLLAFGMLAWSDTPVLHYFGITVLLGLSIVWLLTPLMRKCDLGEMPS